LSRLPLMYAKVQEGSLPVCHEAEHVVWGGGQCCDFGKLDKGERQMYLQKLADSLKRKLIAKMELIAR